MKKFTMIYDYKGKVSRFNVQVEEDKKVSCKMYDLSTGKLEKEEEFEFDKGRIHDVAYKVNLSFTVLGKLAKDIDPMCISYGKSEGFEDLDSKKVEDEKNRFVNNILQIVEKVVVDQVKEKEEQKKIQIAKEKIIREEKENG